MGSVTETQRGSPFGVGSAIYMKPETVYLPTEEEARRGGGENRLEKYTELFEATDKEIRRNREKGAQM